MTRKLDLNRAQEMLTPVIAEFERAHSRFPPFNSPHEGWAVIREELDELWDEIKADRGREESAIKEAQQVAAMALRYLYDLGGGSACP